MASMAELAREIGGRLKQSLGRFTTDPAVRTGIMQAAWSVAPAFARGLLPRSPSQQATIVAATTTTHYALGATSWAGISSIAAGVPGRRAGYRALLVTAAAAGTGGFVAEKILRPRSGDNMVYASAWSSAKLLATTGLAGGIVTASDLVVHSVWGRRPGVGTTLAVDVASGAAMAVGTLVRRNLRAKKFGLVDADRHAVRPVRGVRAYALMAGIGTGTTLAIAATALGEQTAARAINAGLTRAVGEDLGETGTLLAHSVTAAGFAAAGLYGLKRVRARTLRANEVLEPAYPSPPTSPRVSCGPNSSVAFDQIGKEGRRFVLMALTAEQVGNIMGEPAVDPVRAVVPRDGSIAERAELAVAELESLGGFDRSIIVVASPTGVGYVNYVMAEALEYLARGNCAIVVPQYALVPSALALDRTEDGTRLQAEVLTAIHRRIERMPEVRRPRLYQFGESLGAQVALDVAAEGGVHRLDRLGVTAGLYLGVPFRSRTWHKWRDNPDPLDPDGRLVVAPDSETAPRRPGMHLMVIHHDDPVNKFAYTMFVRRPDWFAAPHSRPPMVPRETLFRPITSFVIAVMDLLNGMNQRPGHFRRIGHDYRIDMRESLEKAYGLSTSPVQAESIEHALRTREEMWAQARLVARSMYRAMNTISRTLDQWGQSAMNLDFAEEHGVALPPMWRGIAQQMRDSPLGHRLGSSGPPG
jgi:uncharacterized membrane protein